MSLILKKYQINGNDFIFPKQNTINLKQQEQNIQDNIEILLQKYPSYHRNELEQYLYDFDGDQVQVDNMLQNEHKNNNQLVNQYGSLQTIFKNLSIKKNDHQFQHPNMKQYSENIINNLTTYTDKQQAIDFLMDQFLQYSKFEQSSFKQQIQTLQQDNQILRKAFKIQNRNYKQLTQKLKSDNNQSVNQTIQKHNAQLQKKVQQLNTENFNLKLRIQLMEQNGVQNQNQQIL